MGVALLLSLGEYFWWDGCRFTVVFWWVFLVGAVSLYCCLLLGVSGRTGVALLLSSGGCFWLAGCHFMVVPGCQDGCLWVSRWLSLGRCLWLDGCTLVVVSCWMSQSG